MNLGEGRLCVRNLQAQGNQSERGAAGWLCVRNSQAQCNESGRGTTVGGCVYVTRRRKATHIVICAERYMKTAFMSTKKWPLCEAEPKLTLFHIRKLV
jgi:hypothetical protein